MLFIKNYRKRYKKLKAKGGVWENVNGVEKSHFKIKLIVTFSILVPVRKFAT